MLSEKMYLYSWIARVIERTALSFIIIAIALVLIAAFWKSLQKIDFDIKSENNSVRTNIVFATPIFVLLILVAFTFVSFSNPILLKTNNVKPHPNSGSSERLELSYYGASDDNDIINRIKILHMSNQKILAFMSGEKNKTVLTESLALLKTVKKDMVYLKYGEELVNNCINKKSKEYNDQECKKIREWVL